MLSRFYNTSVLTSTINFRKVIIIPLPNAPTKLATILDKKELSSKKNLSNSNKKNRKTTKNSFSKISTNVRSKEPNIISPPIQTKKLKVIHSPNKCFEYN